MPISVMKVDYASRSIARRENLMKKQTLSIVPQHQASRRGRNDPIEDCAWTESESYCAYNEQVVVKRHLKLLQPFTPQSQSYGDLDNA